MKKTLSVLLAIVLVLALAVTLGGCKRKVTVTTGEIIICTAGEIIEDNTEEIEVPEDEVDQYGVTTTVITCETHGSLGTLYDEAQRAIASGDLTTARERLATIVESDPTYRKAKEQLDAIDAGKTPEVDAGTDTADGTTQPGDDGTDEPTGPVVSLMKYVPDTIDGYVAQGILADAASLSRQYIPTGGDADQLVIEVEQRVDANAAKAQQAVIAGEYPEGATSKTIGSATVIAGARGQFAAAVFVDGPLTIIVELHATGDSGTDLIESALAVAESIAK